VTTALQLDANSESALPIAATRRVVASKTGREYPDRHAILVAACADRLARRLELTHIDRRTVVAGALLHDVGKLLVDDRILEKPGPLTLEERREINGHPIKGALIVHASVDPEVVDVVRSHHERWDGDGYPRGLVGREIPLAARIVAVADAYLAMLEDRPYRHSLTEEEALRELEDGAGTQFDPRCVAAFVSLVGSGSPQEIDDSLAAPEHLERDRPRLARVEKFQRQLGAVCEEPLSGAQDDRVHDEVQFVDKVVGE
jgi:putative nucleotidyltransferase with HDIG domain